MSVIYISCSSCGTVNRVTGFLGLAEKMNQPVGSCRKCKAPLIPANGYREGAPSEQKYRAVKKCPACGRENSVPESQRYSDSNYCSGCGSKLDFTRIDKWAFDVSEPEDEEEEEDERDEREEALPVKPATALPIGKYGTIECYCGTVTPLSSIDRNVYCSGCGRLIIDISKQSPSPASAPGYQHAESTSMADAFRAAGRAAREQEHTETESYTRAKQEVQCPYCGLLNPIDEIYCQECGCPLHATEEYLESLEEHEKDNTELEASQASVFTKTKPSFSKDYMSTRQEPNRYQPQGGKWRIGRNILTGDYVDAPQVGRREGLYIIGTSGTGKTGLIENLIIQDIKQGMGVGLLDPHGDLTQAVLGRIPDRREQDVIYLDITDEDYPFGLNLFTCNDPNSAKAVQVVVDKVMHVFDKLFELSAATTPRLRQYLRNCTQTLLVNPGYTMADMPLLLLDEHCRKKLVANVTNTQVQSFWKTFNRMKLSEQLDHADSTLNKLDELLQPLTIKIVGQSTSSVDVRTIMDEGKILLVKLSAQLDSVTSLIGSVLIALFLNAAYARPANKRRQFNLYADEFQRFATDDFATLLTEARKFGIATTIAHQARYQPGMTDGIRATSLSTKNLVVFKVNSKDADELAGEFDITPQEAWEEVLEEEWVEVLRPQRHERIEEQVEVEVEEDIEEIPQNPVDYLASSTRSHANPKVRYTASIIIPLLKNVRRRENEAETKLNSLLVEVMEKRLPIKDEEFIRRVTELVLLDVGREIGWLTAEEAIILRSELVDPPDFIRGLETTKSLVECLTACIQAFVVNRSSGERFRTEVSKVRIPFLMKRYEYNLEKHFSEEEAKQWIKQYEEEIKKEVPEQVDLLITFLSHLINLCEGLANDPIRVPTGQKRMVKRIQPHITYLTHESEKTTHPRKTILHPQRTYADVHNEVASELVNQDNYIARVRYINADQRNAECTIRTLDPKQDPDTRPLFGQALEERIVRIKLRNIQEGYLRERTEVEAEIRQRQERCCEPPNEPPDAIYRRQQR